MLNMLDNTSEMAEKLALQWELQQYELATPKEQIPHR
jgi:hypothetical protein